MLSPTRIILAQFVFLATTVFSQQFSNIEKNIVDSIKLTTNNSIYIIQKTDHGAGRSISRRDCVNRSKNCDYFHENWIFWIDSTKEEFHSILSNRCYYSVLKPLKISNLNEDYCLLLDSILIDSSSTNLLKKMNYDSIISGIEGVVTSYSIYLDGMASKNEIQFLEDLSLNSLGLNETFKGLLQKLVYSFQNEEFKHQNDGMRSQIYWDE